VTRRSAAAGIGLVASIAMVAVGGAATAASQPTAAQVQARLSKLNTQASKLGQQFDQAQQELASARQRLMLVNREESRYRARFSAMRAEVGQIAATAYEQGSLSSSAALLTSGNPQQILNQSSILVELSSTNSAEMRQFIAAARQLTGAQQAARRAEEGIAQLKSGLAGRRRSLNRLIGQQQALLAQLTPAQRQQAEPGGGSGGGSGGTSGQKPPPYTGATSTQAEKAVAFAYAQIGKPYVYGAAGPNAYDCSGLMMASWDAAGVSIERTSYEQMSSLPSVPTSDMKPGDILGFAGNSHVGMYVGNGYLIDAPVPGAYVEKVPLSGWYAQELDGVVQP